MTATPKQISRLAKEAICYYGETEDTDVFKHVVSVSKVIFDNSQKFIVNATNDELEKAIRLAVKLPQGEGVKVGEPLYPMIEEFNRQCIYTPASSDPKLADYKDLDTQSLAQYPNTILLSSNPNLKLEEKLAKYMQPKYHIDKANVYLLAKMEDEGVSATAINTSLDEQLCNKKDIVNKEPSTDSKSSGYKLWELYELDDCT